MTIAIPQSTANTTRHTRAWVAAGTVAFAATAGAILTVSAMSGSDHPTLRPSSAVFADQAGLSAIFSVRVPASATYVDRSGVSRASDVALPADGVSGDRTGLGQAFGVRLPTATYVDVSGVGVALSVQVPQG